MVGVDAIVDIAHEMETILRDLDRGGAKTGVPAPRPQPHLLVSGLTR